MITKFKRYYCTCPYAVLEVLQRLQDKKRRSVIDWQVMSHDDPVHKYIFFVETFTWKKKK